MLTYGTFLNTWYRLGATSHPGKAYTKICDRYSEPHRYYHTSAHISDCLQQVSLIPHLSCPECYKDTPQPEVTYGQMPQLIMALICHDVIYNVLSHDNEKRSARFTDAMLRSGGVAETLRKEICGAILSTKPGVIPEGGLARTVSDIDISIFGASEEKFNNYDMLEIKLEYPPSVVATLANLPLRTTDEIRMVNIAYCKGRAGILRGYLERPSVYLTEFFKFLYEKQARNNLTRAIERLENRKAELEK